MSPYCFDVMVRSFAVAQLTHSICTYIFYEMADQFPNINRDLYQNFSDQNLQRVKNRLVKYFGNKGLNIMFDEDKIEAIFLSNDFYFLYHKPPTNLNYMNVFSNHPKTITRSLEMFHVDFLG